MAVPDSSSSPSSHAAEAPSPYPPTHIFSWLDIEQILEAGHVHLLARRPDQLADYDRWIDDCERRYHTVDDYIKHVLFGWSVDRAGGVIRAVRRPQLVPESVSHSTDASTTNGSAPSATVTATAHPQRPRPSPRQIILRLNDFPYSLDTTITHYCLWSSEELPAEHIERHLAVSFGLARSLSDSGLRHSGSEPPRNAETIADHSIRDGAITTTMRNRLLWFMNPPHRKSVKDVWHVHVFVKL